MHDIAFDAIHDEIAVTSPLAQAILSFRGAANGEEAPLRVIQGNKTQIKGVGATGKVSIDPAHDEIFLATPDQTIDAIFGAHDGANRRPILALRHAIIVTDRGARGAEPLERNQCASDQW